MLPAFRNRLLGKFVLCQVLAQRDRLLARRKETEPLIGVHKRVDNPGTARMQLEQRMLSTQAYLQAARTLEESFETCFVQGGEWFEQLC